VHVLDGSGGDAMKDFKHMLVPVNLDEFLAVCDAAADCHMDVSEYARMMLLVAAGMGGILEHACRAGAASFKLAEATAKPARKKGKAKR
jgi:hypothetical protein